jgi:hypothetical protein
VVVAEVEHREVAEAALVDMIKCSLDAAHQDPDLGKLFIIIHCSFLHPILINDFFFSIYEDFSRDSFDDRRPGMRGTTSPTRRYAPY